MLHYCFGSEVDPLEYVSESTVQQTSQVTLPAAPNPGFQIEELTTGGRLAMEWTIPYDTGGVPHDSLNFELELLAIEPGPMIPKAENHLQHGWLQVENDAYVATHDGIAPIAVANLKQYFIYRLQAQNKLYLAAYGKNSAGAGSPSMSFSTTTGKPTAPSEPLMLSIFNIQSCDRLG